MTQSRTPRGVTVYVEGENMEYSYEVLNIIEFTRYGKTLPPFHGRFS